MASVASNINDDNIILMTIPECCTDSIQCRTEENEIPAVEMIMATYQLM